MVRLSSVFVGTILTHLSREADFAKGKLICAVTHVLVDDATKGFGIFADELLDTAQSICEKQFKQAS